ncbi:hypothetical protein [Paraburkholderia fungorum]|nr:hypothetical protein [Paraburkholderia fungorum]
MKEQYIEDDHARHLADRVRLLIYAWNRPLRRLVRDVENLACFDSIDGPMPPHLQLACAAPPLTPPASAIVDAVVRIWGDCLVSAKAGRLMVGTLAVKGPISGAESLVLMWNGQQPDSPRLQETDDAFRTSFARYPELYLADARKLLQAYTSRLPGDTKTAHNPKD